MDGVGKFVNGRGSGKVPDTDGVAGNGIGSQIIEGWDCTR